MIKKIVVEAYTFAEECHKGVMRKHTDIPYFTHPKYVARVVSLMTNDPEMTAAALLHDVVEDCEVLEHELRERFGNRVTDLVLELTNDPVVRGTRTKKEYMYEKFRKLSPDAFLIKLVDRYHNLLFLERDCGTQEQHEFIVYYVSNTSFIINEIEDDISFEVKDTHKDMLRRIRAIIEFLKIAYNLR